MEKKCSWKRTEEIEIDLLDLLCRLCMRWKQIILCALIMAVFFGGYSFLKERGSADASGTDALGADAAEDIVLTEEEEQAVTAAIQLESEIRGLEEYLDNSVLMKIDAYHKNKAVMLYSIEQADIHGLQKIMESYLNFITCGGAADGLKGSGDVYRDMDKSYLAELVTAYQKTDSSAYQIVLDGDRPENVMTEALFCIEVTGEDAEMAEQLAEDMQALLEDYRSKVEKAEGSHKLSLVSCQLNVQADSDLQTCQHDKRALLSTDLTSLKTMTDAFTEGQMAVYQDAVDRNDDEDMGEETDVNGSDEGAVQAAVSAWNIRAILKYFILGSAAGIFIYCSVFFCSYLFRDTVKSTEELKRLYTFPVYGSIHADQPEQKGGHLSKGPTGKRAEACRQETVQALNRIRLACKKQSITKICLASGAMLCNQEKKCLEEIVGQLKDWGIDAVLAQNISGDTAMWDTLAEIGNILIVCRVGTMTHRMVDSEMEFYLENEINVAGVIALVPDGRR